MSEKGIQDIEYLFKEYYQALCVHAYRILNNTEVAEDIVQDVFMKLWNKKDQININTSVKSYLYKSTTNTALNYLEKNKVIVQSDEALEFEPNGQVAPDLQMSAKQLKSRIDEAINNLPPKCKTIFILSRHEGMKYKQIADHLNISVKTVENQMSIALERIREHIKQFI